MNGWKLSPWDRLQLWLLRLLSIVLGVLDDVLNVHWGERLLARLARRWQIRLAQIDADLAGLEEERRMIQGQTEALALHAAAMYLSGRALTDGTLVLDPADEHDEKILDASIDLLVKNRLASIETRQVEPGRYVYALEPDWPAIRARLETLARQAPAESAHWFQDSLPLIDEILRSTPGSEDRGTEANPTQE